MKEVKYANGGRGTLNKFGLLHAESYSNTFALLVYSAPIAVNSSMQKTNTAKVPLVDGGGTSPPVP